MAEPIIDFGDGWFLQRWTCVQEDTGCCVGGGPHVIANPYHCRGKRHFYSGVLGGGDPVTTASCACGATRGFTYLELYGKEPPPRNPIGPAWSKAAMGKGHFGFVRFEDAEPLASDNVFSEEE